MLVIRSATGTASLELDAVDRGFFDATIVDGTLRASTRVPHFAGGDWLGAYWTDIAASWRGWPDAKIWKSCEGDLQLTATFDRIVHLLVTLQHGAPWQWRVQFTIRLESWQLDDIAANAVALCRHLGAVA